MMLFLVAHPDAAKEKEMKKSFSHERKIVKLAIHVCVKNLFSQEEIMKKSLVLLLLTMLSMTTYSQAATSQDTHLGQAVEESGKAVKAGAQASGHASASAAHALVGSGQVVSAAASVPLAVGGSALTSAGAASTAAAKGLQQAASAPAGKPLDISEESMSTTPPDKALQR